MELSNEITEELLNFFVRLKLNGALRSDLLGDRLKGEDCDEKADKLCRMMVKKGYLETNGFTYSITDKGEELVKNRTIYKT